MHFAIITDRSQSDVEIYRRGVPVEHLKIDPLKSFSHCCPSYLVQHHLADAAAAKLGRDINVLEIDSLLSTKTGKTRIKKGVTANTAVHLGYEALNISAIIE